MAKQLKQDEQSQPERRIVKVELEEITSVIEFKVFVVQPDGKGRVVGGGAFEEQDLERVAEELIDLAEKEADCKAYMRRLFQGIEEDEGDDV